MPAFWTLKDVRGFPLVAIAVFNMGTLTITNYAGDIFTNDELQAFSQLVHF